MANNIAIIFLLVLSVAWQTYAAVDCTSTGAGRFADPDDTTCQNYTLCIYNSITLTYRSYNYICPKTTVFNPLTSQCTTASNYVCNIISSNSKSNLSVCTTEGYVADPKSTNCTSYIECVEVNSTFIETTYTCPDDTFYNPSTTLCEADYNCITNTPQPHTTTHPPPITITTPQPYSYFTANFPQAPNGCTSARRFADDTDTTCKSYYLCLALKNGSYRQQKYTCTGITVFNPSSRLCTVSYTCTRKWGNMGLRGDEGNRLNTQDLNRFNVNRVNPNSKDLRFWFQGQFSFS